MIKRQNITTQIPTYVINVKERVDRRKHIIQQFSDKPEFDMSIIDAAKHSIGAIGLWETTLKIINDAKSKNLAYILICEDDHQFTDKYIPKEFQRYILQGVRANADVLLGGIHWFDSVLNISPGLFWVDKFTATQFIVVYHKFFDILLAAEFKPTDISDLKISELTDNKLVIFPFISTQKDFGYSDVTDLHREPGYIQYAFDLTAESLNQLVKVQQYYNSIPLSPLSSTISDIQKTTIPTYILCEPRSESENSLNKIRLEFEFKEEFDTVLIESDKDITDANWERDAFLKAIACAIKNNYDVIVICKDNHEFTDDYSWKFLLKNIVEAYQQNADLLYGGSLDFGVPMAITSERLWINQIFSMPFVVIFSKIFPQIQKNFLLGECRTISDLSRLTDDKMLILPAIAKQSVFDTYGLPNDDKSIDLIHKILARTKERLIKITQALQSNVGEL